MRLLTALLLMLCLAAWTLPSTAEPIVPAPYDRLNLSEPQKERIKQLEADWSRQYGEMQPQLDSAQKRLVDLLSAPKTDSLEITETQQKINHLREQLSSAATANYLRKRQILNNKQRKELESWMKRQLAEKQRERRSMATYATPSG